MPRLRAWLRDELTSVVRSEITDTGAGIETTLQTGLTELHREFETERTLAAQREALRDHELASAMTQLAGAISSMQNRLDADISERHLHLSSVEWLMRELIIGFPPTYPEPASIIGGTIDRDANAPIDATTMEARELTASEEIDLREAERVIGMMVEVRSRFHDRWIRGFQIRDIIDVGDIRRFRLTRISDHMTLPVLFDSTDIRPLPVQPEFEAAERTV